MLTELFHIADGFYINLVDARCCRNSLSPLKKPKIFHFELIQMRQKISVKLKQPIGLCLNKEYLNPQLTLPDISVMLS